MPKKTIISSPAIPDPKFWSTYIVECADGTYYTGVAPDVHKRIEKHNSGKGAKYTKSRSPVVLCYFEQHENRSEASKREAEIKKLTRSQKKKLIDNFSPNVGIFINKIKNDCIIYSMRKILVVGASGGIGNKVAEYLLQNGDEVIGTYYKHPENLQNLKNVPNFSAVMADLKDSDSVANLIDATNTTPTKLFAVINCAGIVLFEGDSVEKDLAIWQETLAVNLSGNFYLAKLLLDILLENGRFIMISSTDALYGGSITASYAASKAGVNSLTKSLSLVMKDKKIRVNSIAPGWVETPMALLNGTDYLKKVASINPLDRNGQPLDIAQVINFLLSPDSDYINGQTISVEGGYTNQDPTLLLEEEVQG